MSNTIDVKNEIILNKKERTENTFQFNKPITYVCSNDHKEIDRLIEISTGNLPNVILKEYREIGEVEFNNKSSIGHYNDLLSFLDSTESDAINNTVIIILRNVSSQLKDKKVLSKLELISEKTNYNSQFNFFTIIISNDNTVEKEIDYLTSIINIKKPDLNGIKSYVYNYINQYSIEYKEDDIEELCFALLGLSYIQIHQILNRFKTSGIISSYSKQIIIQEKSEIIEKSGIIELITFKENINDIGGLDTLKDWLKNKAEIFSRLEEAIEFGVDIPKGLLLMGMPGCGKSLSAKAAARLFNLPLLRLDIGRLLGKYVGESEENFRNALELAESISPVILWVDEIEKAFSGIDQSGGASDITKRLFGHFLTWLQEKENTVFVVATANDISSFPPEFLRKGRFDEIFYIGFPDELERESIFKIHLEKRNIINELINTQLLAVKTKGFSGADIESVIKESIELSFINDERLSQENIIDIIKKTDPISVILEDKIDKLKRKLSKFRIKSASNYDLSNNIKYKDFNYIKGSEYKPSFSNHKLNIKSFYMCKYQVTQEKYTDIMKNNPSNHGSIGLHKPVVSITWLSALKYCNKLSIKNNLQPVYKIEEELLTKIVYRNGDEVAPNCADFSKTEGYRLPTEIEWEWAASGGLTSQQNEESHRYSGSDDINVVAKYAEKNPNQLFESSSYGRVFTMSCYTDESCGHKPNDVGNLNPNNLGLYDMSGNVWEYVFDSYPRKGYNESMHINKREYIFDSSDKHALTKGGGCCNSKAECLVTSTETIDKEEVSKIVGFRVCKSN